MQSKRCRVRCAPVYFDAQVKTGDSSSWTSLSTWISIETVISSSALRHQRGLLKQTHKICSRFDACSYACASRHSEKAATALCDHER